MKKIIRHLMSVLIVAAAVALSAADCVFIDRYYIAQLDSNGREVYYAQAQQNVTFTLNGHIECRTTDNDGCTTKYVFAILAR